MSDITLGGKAGINLRPTYFVAMAILVIIFAFGGFGITYLFPMAAGTFKGVRPSVHVHGILFFAWTLVLLLQTTLVARGNRALHRTVGMAGISLATAMVVIGFIVSLQSTHISIVQGETAKGYWFGFSGTSAVVFFGAFFAMAIKDLSRLDYHKRWMLMATCFILNAPVNRLLSPLFDDPTPLLATLLLIGVIPATCLIYDIRTRGRPHIVTLIGSGVLLVKYFGTAYFSATEIWHRTYDFLLLLISPT